MAFRAGLLAVAAFLTPTVLAQPPSLSSDPGPPLSGYPRKALQPPQPQDEGTAGYVRDVIYGRRDGMALTYDVFRPLRGANGALVVNIVSAGWRSAWGPPEDRQGRYQWLIDKGFTVVALYHASAPRFPIPDAVADVSLGLRHIRLHAADYGADPRRIGVWGASAGGHLALMAGLDADDGDDQAQDVLGRSGNRVQAVVAYFPPTDLEALLRGRPREGAIDFNESLRASLSPVNYADAGDPPVLIISGGADTGVPLFHSEVMQARLDRAGVPNVLKVFPDAGHDFYVKGDPVRTDGYALEAMNAMVAWFEERLK
jgi:acetyl esterase/lipase